MDLFGKNVLSILWKMKVVKVTIYTNMYLYGYMSKLGFGW